MTLAVFLESLTSEVNTSLKAMIFCPKMSEVALHAPWLTEQASSAFSISEESVGGTYKGKVIQRQSGTWPENSLGLRDGVNFITSDKTVSEAELCSLAYAQHNFRLSQISVSTVVPTRKTETRITTKNKNFI